MLIAAGFSWFHLLGGVESGTLMPWAHDHGYIAASAFFVAGVIVLFSIAANVLLKRRLASADGFERYYSSDRLDVVTVTEMFVDGISGLLGDMMSREHMHRFLPLVGGIFAYILVCNLLAVVPGFQPPTDNINTNLGMAIVVALVYWGVGLFFNAKGFFKHLLGPVLILSPLMLVIELISLLAVRPGSLAVRLTGNIFGDHTVYNIMSGLVPFLVPVAFLALAMLVAVIQAFVFSLLTAIYISQSLPHGDHGDEPNH